MSQTNYFQQHCTVNEHSNQLTNYCASLECLRPLCPECIQEHYQYHAINKTPQAIQSITNTRLQCERKIQTAIQNLEKEIQQYDVQYIFNPDDILQQEINKMEEAKSQMIEIIEIFFKQQEAALQNKVRENILKVRNIGGIFQKITDVVAQLEQLKGNLKNHDDPFQYFSKTCRLDAKLLLDKYKSELKKIISTRELDPINVHIDQHRLFNLKLELNKIVQVLSPVHHQNLSGSVNNEFEVDDSVDHHQHPTKPAIQPIVAGFKDTGNNPSKPSISSNKQIATQSELIKDFIVQRPNFFSNQAHLHFFKHGTKEIQLIDLNGFKLTRIHLEVDPIPLFHKSITLPNGDIYISGGTLSENSPQKEPMIRRLDLKTRRFDNVASMLQPRSSHAMIYCNNSIYILGGYATQGRLCVSMEKLNPQNNRIEGCATYKYPSPAPTCCSFNDKYIYKFGGLNLEKRLVLSIERYTVATNSWEEIDARVDQVDQFEAFYQSGAACQINQNTIFVFGGYNENDQGVQFSFLLRINENDHQIIRINQHILPYPEAFWNNQVVIHNNKLFALQNIEVQENVVDEDNRCLLSFDGKEWIEQQQRL